MTLSHPPHLKTLEEIEAEGISGLVEVLREEGLDAVRYVLWDTTNARGLGTREGAVGSFYLSTTYRFELKAMLVVC